MAAGDEKDLIEAVVTCEGNLHDPDFQDRFRTLVDSLKTALYISKTKDPFRVRKIEPWNSVRVTISIPKEAAQKLKLLAQQGSNVLRSMGILSVQVEGDQVISLTWAAQNNEATQVILRQTSDDPSSSSSGTSGISSSSSLPASSPSLSSLSSSMASIASPIPLTPGPSSSSSSSASGGGETSGMAVTLDMLSSSSSSSSSTSALSFRSPNVVAPGGEPIPILPPKQASSSAINSASCRGPFPFVSMVHAAQAAIQRNEMSPMTMMSVSNNNINNNNNNSGSSNAANSTNSSIVVASSSHKSIHPPPHQQLQQQSNFPVTSSNQSGSGALVIVSTSSSICNVNSNSSGVGGGGNGDPNNLTSNNVALVSHPPRPPLHHHHHTAGPSHQSLQQPQVNVPPPYPAGVNNTTISSNHLNSLSSSSSSSSPHHFQLRHQHPQQQQQSTLISNVGPSPNIPPPPTLATVISDSTSGISSLLAQQQQQQQISTSPLLVNLLQNQQQQNDGSPSGSSAPGPSSLSTSTAPSADPGYNQQQQAKLLLQQQLKKTKRGQSLDGASATTTTTSTPTPLNIAADPYQFALPLPSDPSSSTITMNRVSVPNKALGGSSLTPTDPTSSTALLQGRTTIVQQPGSSAQVRTIPVHPPSYSKGSTTTSPTTGETSKTPAHHNNQTLPNGPHHHHPPHQSLATVTLVEQDAKSSMAASTSPSSSSSSSAADQSRTLLPITTVNIVSKSPVKPSSNLVNSNKDSDSKTFIPPPDPRLSSSSSSSSQQVQKLVQQHSNSVTGKNNSQLDAKTIATSQHLQGRTALLQNKRASSKDPPPRGYPPSPGKPRQFLINPLTGHLEPMPPGGGDAGSLDNEISEAGGKTSASNSHKSSLHNKIKLGKGQTSQLHPGSVHHRQIVTTESGVTVARVIKTSVGGEDISSSSIAQSLGELDSSPSIISVLKKPREDNSSATPTTTAALQNTQKDTATSVVPGEKIRLRLKRENSEPISPAYKVDVSFVKKSEKSSVLPISPAGGSASPLSSSASSQSSSTGQDQPRVPPLHISLRGKNAAVVVSPRREEKDMPPPHPSSSVSGNTKESSLVKDPGSSSESPSSSPSKSAMPHLFMNSHDGAKLHKSTSEKKRARSRVKSFDGSTTLNKISSGSSVKSAKMSRPKLSKEVSSSSSRQSSDSKEALHLTMPVLQPAVALPSVLETGSAKNVTDKSLSSAPPPSLLPPDGIKLDTLIVKKITTSNNNVKLSEGVSIITKETKAPTPPPELKSESKPPVLSHAVSATAVQDLKTENAKSIAVAAEIPVVSVVKSESPPLIISPTTSQILDKSFSSSISSVPPPPLPPDLTINAVVTTSSSSSCTITTEVESSPQVFKIEKDQQSTPVPSKIDDTTTFKGAFSSSSSTTSSLKSSSDISPATGPSLTAAAAVEQPSSSLKQQKQPSISPVKKHVSPPATPPPELVEETTTSTTTSPSVTNNKKDESVVSPVINLSTVSCDIINTTTTTSSTCQESESQIDTKVDESSTTKPKTGFETGDKILCLEVAASAPIGFSSSVESSVEQGVDCTGATTTTPMNTTPTMEEPLNKKDDAVSEEIVKEEEIESKQEEEKMDISIVSETVLVETPTEEVTVYKEQVSKVEVADVGKDKTTVEKSEKKAVGDEENTRPAFIMTIENDNPFKGLITSGTEPCSNQEPEVAECPKEQEIPPVLTETSSSSVEEEKCNTDTQSVPEKFSAESSPLLMNEVDAEVVEIKSKTEPVEKFDTSTGADGKSTQIEAIKDEVIDTVVESDTSKTEDHPTETLNHEESDKTSNPVNPDASTQVAETAAENSPSDSKPILKVQATDKAQDEQLSTDTTDENQELSQINTETITAAVIPTATTATTTTAVANESMNETNTTKESDEEIDLVAENQQESNMSPKQDAKELAAPVVKLSGESGNEGVKEPVVSTNENKSFEPKIEETTDSESEKFIEKPETNKVKLENMPVAGKACEKPNVPDSTETKPSSQSTDSESLPDDSVEGVISLEHVSVPEPVKKQENHEIKIAVLKSAEPASNELEKKNQVAQPKINCETVTKAPAEIPKKEDLLEQQQASEKVKEPVLQSSSAPVSHKVADVKAVETKIDKLNAAEEKAVESKIDQLKIAEVKAVENKFDKPKVAEVKALENKFDKPKVAEVKAVENKIDKPKIAEVKATENKIDKPKAEAKAVENKTDKLKVAVETPEVAEVKAVENQIGKPKVAEAKAVENKIENPKVAEMKTIENKIGKPKVAEVKVVETKTDKPKVAEVNAVENKIDKPKVVKIQSKSSDAKKDSIDAIGKAMVDKKLPKKDVTRQEKVKIMESTSVQKVEETKGSQLKIAVTTLVVSDDSPSVVSMKEIVNTTTSTKALQSDSNDLPVPKPADTTSTKPPAADKLEPPITNNDNDEDDESDSCETLTDSEVNITIMSPPEVSHPGSTTNDPPPISIVLPSTAVSGSAGDPSGKVGTKATYKRRAEIKPGALQNTLKRLHDNFLPKVLKTSEKQDALTQSKHIAAENAAAAAAAAEEEEEATEKELAPAKVVASSTASSSSVATVAPSTSPAVSNANPPPPLSMKPSVSIPLSQIRPVPNIIQRPKITVTSTPTLHRQPNIIAVSTSALSTATLTTVVSSSSGGSPQTVYAIHPNMSIPANFAQLQHSTSPMVLPGGHKMVPIKLVTLPKQPGGGPIQTIPLGGGTPNRSSPNLLEAVNIVANAAGSRSSSPKTTLITGNAMQSGPLNLSSMSLPVGSNLHFVPISVSSATGTTGNVKVLMTQPIKMQQAGGLSQQMVVKSLVMGNQPTTIRVIRPANFQDNINLQNLMKPAGLANRLELASNKPTKSSTISSAHISNADATVAATAVVVQNKTEFSIQSDSVFKRLDGVEIVDTGSPLNNDDLPFEADIIHDEKDLADVLAAEAKNEVMENCTNFHGITTAEVKTEEKTNLEINVTTSVQNHVGSKKLQKTELDNMPDSPAPVMRVTSPLFTYSSVSNKASSKARGNTTPLPLESRSPSPLDAPGDLHGEDEEIINSFSRSPSQPRLSPQNTPKGAFDGGNDSSGGGEITNCDTNSTDTRLGQELSIEIPPIDMEVSSLSPHPQQEGKRCTRSTRSNPRLSPDITAFVSETTKPSNKLTAAAQKGELMSLRNSPKPSPTGSLKVLSPTPSSLTITPSTSTRSSPILHNQHQINASNAAATINAVAMGIIDKIQGNATAQNAKNSRISKLTQGANKRKRQESDSSSASRDENMEENKTEIDLNSRPGKRKCSENAAEMIKVCIGVEDSPKRNSSSGSGGNKKTEDGAKGKDGKGGKKPMTTLLEDDDDADSEVSLTRERSGRSSRESSEDRSSSRGSSVQRVAAAAAEKSKSAKEEDSTTKEAPKSSRLNTRVNKDATGKSKTLQSSAAAGKASTTTNTPAAKNSKESTTVAGGGKATPRRVNRPNSSKIKTSPLTPAKTRTNVRKDLVSSGGGGTPGGATEKNQTSANVSSSSAAGTTGAPPDNENARRKTRSSAAGKRHVT